MNAEIIAMPASLCRDIEQLLAAAREEIATVDKRLKREMSLLLKGYSASLSLPDGATLQFDYATSQLTLLLPNDNETTPQP